MKRRVVILGAGLGGCVLADRLAETFEVLMVELGAELPHLRQRVCDSDRPAITNPHIASGLGGTTTVWHNGLIEIDEDVFRRRWPFPKSELAAYYAQAFISLGGGASNALNETIRQLAAKYFAAGFAAEDFGPALYYPKTRVNPWFSLALKYRVQLLDGAATKLLMNPDGQLSAVVIRNGQNELRVDGDVFVLAMGGLATPLLLQDLARETPLKSLQNAGCHYEDHPCAVVGEVVLSQPLYRMWNYPCGNGNLRLPFKVVQDGLQISFQLRPSAHFRVIAPSAKVKSVLSELRNTPFGMGNYVRLLAHWDDIMEILSFKLGVHLPTRRYTVLMVAEQPAADFLAVWGSAGKPVIHRKWTFDKSYLDTLSAGIKAFLGKLEGKIQEARIFPDWPDGIYSSSHHSGTARMGRSPDTAVCNSDGQVFGVPNLFVCDGSAIPASGYANTGLTIAALAIRLGEHLKRAHASGAIDNAPKESA